jgi:hypothetical protein
VAGLIFTILTAVSMLLFMHDLVQSSNDATLHIVAHLLAIRNAGINPRTTPVFQKHRLYRRFLLIIGFGSLELLLAIIVANLFDIGFLPLEVMGDCLITIVLALLAFVFRLRPEGVVKYERIAEDGGVQEMLMSDLDGVDVAQLDGGREWVDGMALPAPPEIVRERHADAPAEIVLASPDGTATIPASIAREEA